MHFGAGDEAAEYNEMQDFEKLVCQLSAATRWRNMDCEYCEKMPSDKGSATGCVENVERYCSVGSEERC